MLSAYRMDWIRRLRAAAAAHARHPTPETKAALIAAERLCFDRAGVCPDGTIAYAVMELHETNVDAPTSPTWGAKPTGEWRQFAEYGDAPSPSEPRTVERPPMPHGPDSPLWGPDSPSPYESETYARPRARARSPTRPSTPTSPVAAKRTRVASTGWD